MDPNKARTAWQLATVLAGAVLMITVGILWIDSGVKKTVQEERENAIAVASAGVLIGRLQAGTLAPEGEEPLPPPPPLAAEPGHTDGNMQRAMVQYEHDRDLLRKAHPKTEDAVVALLGRQPDHIVDVSQAQPPHALLEWDYHTNFDSQKVILITVESDKVVLMAF